MIKTGGKIFIFLLCLWGWSIDIQAEESPRKVMNFNREWRYIRGNIEGAEKLTFDDRDWEAIGLPHSFSIPYFMSKDFYVGYGWYRKTFCILPDELDKKIFLEFDGVFQEAEVFVNGQLTGGHLGGYTGFSVDISSQVKAGDNLVAVRVNNVWRPDVAPRAGEHVFSGGIYRNVRLVKKSPVYIDWYGTFVTTPDLQKTKGKSSRVHVETEIRNQSDRDGQYKLVIQILDPQGHIVVTEERIERIPAKTVKAVKQITEAVDHPGLWHPDRPVVYKVVSTLYKGNVLLDRDETGFGFRWFEWTADRGFFLNGKHLYFKGANVHQDQAGWGDAVTESAMRRDVRMIKEAGFNLIRGSHYPHAPAFSRACDEEGILFWSEAPFWGIGGFKPDGYWDSSAYPVNEKEEEGFEASALQQLEEMIRIHRNHPSIVVWSMSNEAFFSAPEALPGVQRLLKKMVALSRRLDPTRPAAVGGAQRPLGKNRIDLIGDIAGYNGDGSTLPDFQRPGIPSVVSEYGSTTAERPGEYIPGWGDLQKGDAWKGLPWRSGQAIWCGFDHGSIAGSQLGKMGIIDYFRLPKRSWYWYRNEYARVGPPEWPKEGVPAQLKLSVTKSFGVLADGTDDAGLIVTVLDAEGKEISNSPVVELKLLSGPGEFPTGTAITFDADSDIRIADGKAAISFRSYYAGTALIEASSPGLKPARAEISFEGGPRYVEGVTQPVRERPYKRYVREINERVVQTFGPNNPTFTSSQQTGKTAGLAADGEEDTWWQAAENDLTPEWILDTEKGLELQEIWICFPRSGAYQYKVETSADQLSWETLWDNQANVLQEKERKIDLTGKGPKMYGRFIRVRFRENRETLPAAIAEVKVKGIVCE